MVIPSLRLEKVKGSSEGFRFYRLELLLPNQELKDKFPLFLGNDQTAFASPLTTEEEELLAEIQGLSCVNHVSIDELNELTVYRNLTCSWSTVEFEIRQLIQGYLATHLA